MYQTCRHCKVSFEITDSDCAFYEKISPVFEGQTYRIPPPTLCPDCRQQRRLAWRNERKLYNRKSDLSGQEIISVLSPDKNQVVYANKEWWSDSWDASLYAQEFDFRKSFFEQFSVLLQRVPLFALMMDSESINCDYNQSISASKNCYLIAAGNRNQDCLYGNYINDSQNCIDNCMIRGCERCYQCIDCEGCFQCFFSQNCLNCSTSAFLIDCIGCNDCFGCVNLRHQQYCFLNKQLTRDEYQKQLQKIQMGKYDSLAKMVEYFRTYALSYPRKYMIGQSNDHVSGSSIYYCKDTFDAYDVSALEDCRYVSWLHTAKDCQDIFAWGSTAELCYECMEVGGAAYRNIFSVTCIGAQDILYSYLCMNSCRDLFGCVGLKNKRYCILNKQYTKEEYEKLIPKIIEQMQKNGEWGEFFPMQLSPFAYNETVAQEYFPLEKAEAVRRGYRWKEDTETTKYFGPKIEIPDNIRDVSDDITKQILTCATCSRKYKVIVQELRFYREMHLPVPRKCPDCRHKNRMALRNPRKLWDRTCMKCRTPIQTSYAPDRKEIVYCETCYQKDMY